MQRGVAVECGGHGFLRLRERGRVENDQIEALLLVAQVLEHVGGDEAVLVGRKPVQLEVFSSELDRGGVTIDRDHLARSAEGGADREAAAVGKAVQGARAAFGKTAQREAVLSLIEEVARLLSRADVDRDLHAVLAHDDGIGRFLAPQGLPFSRRALAIFLEIVFVLGARLLVAAVDPLERDLAAQGLEDVGAVRCQTRGVELENGEFAVEVDHHSREAVILAMNQTNAVGRTIRERRVGAPQRHRARDPPSPE